MFADAAENEKFESSPNDFDQINIETMIKFGVHYGHKRSYWNPKMLPYLYGISRNDAHIIDLEKTSFLLQTAIDKVRQIASAGGRVLFVGTKMQASKIIAEEATRCGQYYVDYSWSSGMLTNWNTVSNSIKKIAYYEKILLDENISLKKKEILSIRRKLDKMLKIFSGIRTMGWYPDVLFVIDTNKEHIAIKEATKLGIPVIAVVDSNSDPSMVKYPIPGNDDSSLSILYFSRMISNAVLAGIEADMRTKKGEWRKKKGMNSAQNNKGNDTGNPASIEEEMQNNGNDSKSKNNESDSNATEVDTNKSDK